MKRQHPPASHCRKGPSAFLYEASCRRSPHKSVQAFLNGTSHSTEREIRSRWEGMSMAEREGFEPSVPLLGDTRDFQSRSFSQLGHLSATAHLGKFTPGKKLLSQTGWPRNQKYSLPRISHLIRQMRIHSKFVKTHNSIHLRPDSG